MLETSTGQGLQALKTARMTDFFVDFPLGEQVAHLLSQFWYVDTETVHGPMSFPILLPDGFGA